MSDWKPHGFSKRVHALDLVVYQLKDGARWEVKGEIFEAAGFCRDLDNAKGRAEDAADAIDRLESLVSDGEPSGKRAQNIGTGWIRKRCMRCDPLRPTSGHEDDREIDESVHETPRSEAPC